MSVFSIYPEWILGKDGLPINPKANKDCTVCYGYGVVDVGDNYSSILANCPQCIQDKKEEKLNV